MKKKLFYTTTAVALLASAPAYADTYASVDANGNITNTLACDASVCGAGGSWNGVAPDGGRLVLMTTPTLMPQVSTPAPIVNTEPIVSAPAIPINNFPAVAGDGAPALPFAPHPTNSVNVTPVVVEPVVDSTTVDTQTPVVDNTVYPVEITIDNTAFAYQTYLESLPTVIIKTSPYSLNAIMNKLRGMMWIL
jgi:hypothetical protein